MIEQDISTASAGATCRVFISYSHDSTEHERRVRAFADKLRVDGIDAWIDQYVQDPDEGWIKWMRAQVNQAKKALLVFTETYQRRFEGDEEEGKGLGATFEGVIVTQSLYEDGGRNAKFRPVVFRDEDAQFIPVELRRFNRYRVDTPEHYQNLLRWLHQMPGIIAPPVGQMPDLPPEAGLELFASKPDKPPASAPASLPGSTSIRANDVSNPLLREPVDEAIYRDSRRSSEGTLSRERWRGIALYGVISLISFLCGVVLLGMIWNADLLGHLGLTGNLYYLVLLPMGLVAAGFFFGVLRSYALYSGKKLGRMLEVSSSVVAFLLVVIPVFVKPPGSANEVKIGDKVFLHSQQGSYVITAQMSKYNWPRLGNEGKVTLTLLGNGPLRHGSVVQIQSLEDNLHDNDVLGVFAENQDCYYLKRGSNDERQGWRIVKLDPSDPVLHYGDKVYLVNVYANKRLTQDPERQDYLTIDEEAYWWWVLEKS